MLEYDTDTSGMYRLGMEPMIDLAGETGRGKQPQELVVIFLKREVKGIGPYISRLTEPADKRERLTRAFA